MGYARGPDMSWFRKCVAQMEGYVPGEQPGSLDSIVKLNTNENPYPPAPQIAQAIQEELHPDGTTLRLYSDPNAQALRDAAAVQFGVSPDQIVAGNGSDELLTLLIRTFVEPGETIAYPVPTYSLYKTLAAAHGAEVQTCSFGPDYKLPDQLAELGAKLVFVASPNSPSGTSYCAADLRRLAQSLNGVLIIDEAYADFASQHAIDLIRTEPNVVVLRTLSKSYSLAGMRVGLMLANTDLVAGVMKVKDSYNLDRLAIVAGAAALKHSAWAMGNIAKVIKTRTRLCERLTELGLDVLPSEANFVFARLGSDIRAREAYRFLKQNGILIRYFDQPMLADGIRITVGTDDEIDKLLTAIRVFLTQRS